MAERGEHALNTFSGRRLDLDQPRPEDIEVEDIAAALSKVCRFGAQARRFHSVAQHAVLVHQLVIEAGRPDLALAALHHDSHEAFVCDIPAPLKRKMEDEGDRTYTAVCNALDAAIAERFGLTAPNAEVKAVIKRADNMALVIEGHELLAGDKRALERSSQLPSADLGSLPPAGIESRSRRGPAGVSGGAPESDRKVMRGRPKGRSSVTGLSPGLHRTVTARASRSSLCFPGNMFLEIAMPNRFVVECLTADGSWIDWGVFDSSAFERLGDGTYVCATDGSPLYLRCLRQDGSVLYVVDGAGEPYTYRLVPTSELGNDGRCDQPGSKSLARGK